MSSGHHFDDKPGSIAKLRALLMRYPAIGTRLREPHVVLRTFDIPYLGGISTNGRFVYIDRHLPRKSGGVPLDKYIEVHESVEEALVHAARKFDEIRKALTSSTDDSALYEPCHHLATAAENYAVLADGYEWARYEDGLHPDYMPIEHEDILRVPPDLALFPYEGDGKLLARMREVMSETKFTPAEEQLRKAA